MLRSRCLGRSAPSDWPARTIAHASLPAEEYASGAGWQVRWNAAQPQQRLWFSGSRLLLSSCGHSLDSLDALHLSQAAIADAAFCRFASAVAGASGAPGARGQQAVVVLLAECNGLELLSSSSGCHQLPADCAFSHVLPLTSGAVLQAPPAPSPVPDSLQPPPLWLLQGALASPVPLRWTSAPQQQQQQQQQQQPPMRLLAAEGTTVLLYLPASLAVAVGEINVHQATMQLLAHAILPPGAEVLRSGASEPDAAHIMGWLVPARRDRGLLVDICLPSLHQWLRFQHTNSLQLELQHTIAARLAAPLRLLPPSLGFTETLALRTNGQLEYYLDGESLALVAVDDLPPGDSIGAVDQVRGNRFTLTSAMNHSFDLVVDLLPVDATARRLLLFVLQSGLQLRRQMLRRWIVEKDRGGSEWEAVTRALLATMGVSSTGGASSAMRQQAAQQTAEVGHEHAFAALCAQGAFAAVLPASARLDAQVAEALRPATAAVGQPAAQPWTDSSHSPSAEAAAAFCSLHLLLQDWSCTVTQRADAKRLAAVLMRIAHTWRLWHHASWYHALYSCPLDVTTEAAISSVPPLDCRSAPCASLPCGTPDERGFDILHWISLQTTAAFTAVVPASPSRDLYPNLHILLELVRAGFSNGPVFAAQKLILRAAELGLTQDRLSQLHHGIQSLVNLAVSLCHDTPAHDWPAACYDLLQREDLAAFQGAAVQGVSDKHAPLLAHSFAWPLKSSGATEKNVLNSGTLTPAAQFNADRTVVHSLTTTGAENTSQVSQLRFPTDHRLREASRLLDASSPCWIKVKQEPGMTDHLLLAEQQSRLLAASLRTMALAVGRGMATLYTVRPIITKPLHIPDMVLKGKLHPTGSVFELDENTLGATVKTWPLFHNGVAAALRICPKGGPAKITAWLAHHEGAAGELSGQHAGFLMGMGLGGHLDDLSTVTLHSYLAKGHEPTSIGLLLGLAAAKRGTLDSSTYRMLAAHVPALAPPKSAEIEIAPMVQTAALVGLGLVYQGTCHQRLVEVMLMELGRPPPLNMTGSMERESFALACGVGLGLVLLGKGGTSAAIADMRLTDTLRRYFEGGPKFSFQLAPSSEASARVWEPREVNINVTAPGAIMALTLAFLQTNNPVIASMLQVPQSLALLEEIRPDFLLLRALGSALVSWDSIGSSHAWLQTQLPSCLKHALPKKGALVQTLPRRTARRLHRVIWLHITAGLALAMGLRFCGSGSEKALQALFELHELSQIVAKSLGDGEAVRTPRSILLCAMSMIMAGTGNLSILRILRRHHAELGVQVSYGFHMAIHMALGLLFLGGSGLTLSRTPEAIAALLLAFFPRFPAHAGDNQMHLQPLRHLYVLATTPRTLVAADATSSELVHVPVIIELEPAHVAASSSGEAETLRLVTPLTLPVSFEGIKRIVVDESRFYKVELYPSTNSRHLQQLQQTMCIYVKSRQETKAESQASQSTSRAMQHSDRLLGAQERSQTAGREASERAPHEAVEMQPSPVSVSSNKVYQLSLRNSGPDFFSPGQLLTLPGIRVSDAQYSSTHLRYVHNILHRLETYTSGDALQNCSEDMALLQELRQCRMILSILRHQSAADEALTTQRAQCEHWLSSMLSQWSRQDRSTFEVVLPFLSGKAGPLTARQRLALVLLDVPPCCGAASGLAAVVRQLPRSEEGLAALQMVFLHRFPHLPPATAKLLADLAFGQPA